MKKHIETIRKKFKHLKLDEIQMMYALAALVGVVALLLVLWFAYQYYGKPNGETVIVDPEPGQSEGAYIECFHPRVLDGVCVDNDSETNPKIVIVTVENHPDARPQSGLADARIVYEAPVEANYTRFVLVFDESQDVSKVGPVRSVRPYFLDWVSEYGDPMYMHVGGSPDGLEKIDTYDINGLNEFYRGWFYWRSDDRVAPHNVYTSSKFWKKALTDYADQYTTDEYTGWLYDWIEPCEEDCVTEVVASFLPPTYKATWKYNTTTQSYTRYQTGYIHRDKDGMPIIADTIVVQHVKTEVLDAIGRLGMETIGSGNATVFRDGHAIEGQWKKESRTARTRFFDESGEEIPFKAGTIWVEVVNDMADVSWE